MILIWNLFSIPNPLFSLLFTHFSCVHYLPPPDDVAVLKTAHQIYKQMDKLPQALQIAMRMNNLELIKEDFESCKDP